MIKTNIDDPRSHVLNTHMKVIKLMLCSPFYLLSKVKKNTCWLFKARALIKSKGILNLHLGCGDKHIEGYLNCEYRPTKAADIVMDCGNLARFKSNTICKIFSHAFFEHLNRQQQLPLLSDCYRVLTVDGKMIFLGIPDFEVIAENYLAKSPGVRGGIFDLYNVYRYTHGDPEISPTYWLEQLHKSLFDKKYLSSLLTTAGFKNFILFNYCYPGEIIPLNLGFVACKSSHDLVPDEVKQYLSPFSEYVSDMNNISFYL